MSSASDTKKTTLEPLPSYPDIVLGLAFVQETPLIFHWLIFVPFSSEANADVYDGYKIHAIEDYSSGVKEWRFEVAPYTIGFSKSIMTAAIIGRLPARAEHTLDDLTALLSKIPMDKVPDADQGREPRFTCRVWVREAIRLMHASQYIHCPNVDLLEQEMWGYGRQALDTVNNETFEKATLRTALHSRAL